MISIAQGRWIPSETIPLWQQSLQWSPSATQQEYFQVLYTLILKGNEQMNLTRITQPDEFWEKHLWDSLSGLWPWLQASADQPEWLTALSTQSIHQVIDIGTGAGFPALPAAVVCPTWQVTLLDSVKKKIRFLTESFGELGLSNVRAIADRVEFLAHQPSHREQYDLALIRAVGSAPTCAEYTLPLLKVGGIAVLYRGQWTAEEAKQLAQATQQLGGEVLGVQPWQTPLTQGIRHCIYLRKSIPVSDDFPRPAGIPAKQPLA
ncbi:MAG: 16S rRNA (guanine(527)-N(7))-methyltransferase RsmG [Cyanobacteria bacterium J06638_28]